MNKTKILSAVVSAILLGTVATAGGHKHGAKQDKQEKTQKQNKKNKQMHKKGHQGHQGHQGQEENNTTNPDVDTEEPETAELSQELINTLAYMGNEERLAYDVYNTLYAQWGTKQFTNIANNSEIKHIQAVQNLVKTYKVNDNVSFTNVDLPALGYMDTAVEDMEAGTYDVSKIQRLYDDLTAAGAASEEEALKVGCIVEVVDVDDLNEYIEMAEAEEANVQDIIDTFTSLRAGSYNHYWAFDNALKSKGVNAGCCTWDELCHPEYPQR